jgi:Tfp pilus assembly protein FimV
MAIDLRRPADASCRSWLASTLLSLERRHTLEATLEHHPPHFHVAIFPEAYVAYVASLTKRPTEHVLADAAKSRSHTVRRGDTLWSIAHAYHTSTSALRRANDLHSSTIHPGQVLVIPKSS